MVEYVQELGEQNKENRYNDLIFHLEKAIFLGLKERQYLAVKLIYEQLPEVIHNCEKNATDVMTDLIQVFKREHKKLAAIFPQDTQAMEELERKTAKLKNKIRCMQDAGTGT
jgi:hypothetical protein